MTATTSFFSTCCALARGNSSRVTTFSSTPPKFNFAMIVCLLFFLPPAGGGEQVVVKKLHCEYVVLLVKEFVFNEVFAGLGQFEFFQFFVEAFATLDDGDPGAANEFDQAIGFQYFHQFIRFFPLSGGFEHGVIFADHYGAGPVFP